MCSFCSPWLPLYRINSPAADGCYGPLATKLLALLGLPGWACSRAGLVSQFSGLNPFPHLLFLFFSSQYFILPPRNLLAKPNFQTLCSCDYIIRIYPVVENASFYFLIVFPFPPPVPRLSFLLPLSSTQAWPSVVTLGRCSLALPSPAFVDSILLPRVAQFEPQRPCNAAASLLKPFDCRTLAGVCCNFDKISALLYQQPAARRIMSGSGASDSNGRPMESRVGRNNQRESLSGSSWHERANWYAV